MWLNCIWGGVGVGLINLLVYLIVGVFLAGLMVGRTPEYLGKKVEAREMKLASLALLIHPLMILAPAGLFVATDWGLKTEGNPGAHGFYELVYEFTSASANNGSECGGVDNTSASTKRRRQSFAAGPLCRAAGHRHGAGDAHQPLHSDHRAGGDRRLPGAEEADAVHRRHAADRHVDVRLRVVGNHSVGRCAVVPAGGRVGAGGGTFRTVAVWKLSRFGIYAVAPHAAARGSDTEVAYARSQSMSTVIVTARPHASKALARRSQAARRLSRRQGLFAPDLLWAAFKQSFVMLRPDIQWKNPVMFVVEVGTVLSIMFTIATSMGAGGQAHARLSDRTRCVAVSDGAVRQFRLGAGRSPRQSPSRRAAQDAASKRPPSA